MSKSIEKLRAIKDREEPKSECVKALAKFQRDDSKLSQRGLLDKYGKKGEKSAGICMGLSLYWIDAHLRGKDDAEGAWLKSIKEKSVVDLAKKMQANYEHAQGVIKVGSTAAIETQRASLMLLADVLDLRIAGEMPDGTKGRMKGTNMLPDILIPELKTPDAHYLLAYHSFGGTGHAIAAYRGKPDSKGKYRFLVFDPNFGEFSVSKGKFATLLDLLALTYDAYAKKFVGIYVSEIQPSGLR